MGAVFLSYRRGDSEGQARALSLELVKLLGQDSVFMDVDSIALGRDFRQSLQERLGSCDVMIALIGPGWLDTRDLSGNRRLENPTDLVRQEIAAALQRNIPVIPVLLQGAQMPAPERLPDDIKDLSYRNGFELGHSTWESDVREMVKRLGLVEQKATAPAPQSIRGETHPDVPAVPFQRWRLLAAATTAVAIGSVGLLVYLYPKTQSSEPPVAKVAALPQSSRGIVAPPSGRSETRGLRGASSSSGGGLAASGLEFNWPGNDCWDIFRGEQLVTYQCGANQQALEAGTYTIKGKHAAVFMPFQVAIKGGSSTRVEMGGIFDFKWPGNDCWDIFRGEQFVTYQCGTNKQALGAGRYTIKGKHAPVFVPFQVDVKAGSSTSIETGGTFLFKWPGGDCWDIFRGTEFVTYKCGTDEQALQAGTYRIMGKNAPVFNPFEIKVADGAQVKAP
jgi:TIR domain